MDELSKILIAGTLIIITLAVTITTYNVFSDVKMHELKMECVKERGTWMYNNCLFIKDNNVKQ